MNYADQFEVPAGLGGSGNALWCSISAGRTLTGPNLVALLNVCRIADRLDAIEAELPESGLTVTNHLGTETVNPLVSEHRQQFATLVQILGKLGVSELAAASGTGPSLDDRVADELAKRRAAKG